MDDQVFYEGYLICQRYMIDHLYYFRLENDQLTFWNDKTKKKEGCFHMAISEFRLDESDKVIHIDSGTAEFTLKNPRDEEAFELNTWYMKMAAAQNKALMRRQINKQNTKPLQERDFPGEIINQVNHIWGITSSIEELVQSICQRLDYNSTWADYADRISNFSRQLKNHVQRLLINVDEERGVNVFKNTIHRHNIIEKQQSFYSVISAQNFETDLMNIDDQRKTFTQLEGLVEQIDYAEVFGKFRNKYLSEMKLPIIMYQPLSFLQRLTQKFEHSHLLTRADSEKDPATRLAYTVAFALCPFYNIKHRLRLPFEPVPGQKFDYFDERSQVKIRNETVGKGYHVQQSADCRNFTFNQESKLIGKFYGSNLQLKMVGLSKIFLKNSKDTIQYRRPSILIRNMMSNKPFMELFGKIEFKSQSMRAEVIFTGNGMNFTAKIYNADNTAECSVVQDTDGTIALITAGLKKKIEIWKPNDVDIESRFKFSKYALQLNYVPFHLSGHLNDNDSRMRKDMKLLEQGKIQNSHKEMQKNIKQTARVLNKVATPEFKMPEIVSLRENSTPPSLLMEKSGKADQPYK